jgi:hypothetical protein
MALATAGEAETVAIHLENVDVVGQPVEQGAGQALGTEDRCPFIEGQIAGDQRAAAFIPLAEHLEQQLTAHRGEGDIAQLVEDQQLHRGQMLLQAAQSPFVARQPV